jgi:D-alanyl-lipoteichoic acid acyltransferase DltB (MBOAT superfamily)
VLLCASYVFYWFMGGWFALGVITFTILTVYGAGLWAGALRTRRAPRKQRRLPLILCLTLNFGLLLLFRYSGQLLPKIGLLLIPGISFYTFQSVGYLADVYKGKTEPERDVFSFALFVSFFPQLIQGPIARHSEIAADLLAGHGWDWDRARNGVQRILWGYFLKLVVADLAAAPVNTVFANHYAYGGSVLLFAVVLYSVQIYADFAGGISVAIGIGQIVGVTMPENFNQPFFARSLSGFWRRWHITLGTWLKDYLFYPLAISKPFGKLGKLTRRVFGADVGKLIPASAATFVVYIVMGIWHGATWAALVFGLLNGGIITLSLFFSPLFDRLRDKTRIDGGGGFGAAFATVRTLAIMVFLRYFARAGSVHMALSMLKRTLFLFHAGQLSDGTLLTLGLGVQEYVLLLVSFSVLLFRDVAAERGIAVSGHAGDRAEPVATGHAVRVYAADPRAHRVLRHISAGVHGLGIYLRAILRRSGL